MLDEGVPGQPNLDGLSFTDLTIVDGGNGTPSSNPKPATGINLDTDERFTIPDQTGLATLATQFAYRNVVVRNCKFNKNTRGGFLLVNGRNVTISDTQANDTFMNEVNLFDLVLGYFIQRCDNVSIVNCSGNNTSVPAINTIPFVNAGIGVFAISSLTVRDSQFNNSSSQLALLVEGLVANLIVNGLFENCQFNNSTGGIGTLFVEGFHLSDSDAGAEASAQGLKLVNCQFNGASRSAGIGPAGPATQVTGVLMITSRDVIFENCQASNIVSEDPNARAVGFLVGSQKSDPANDTAGATRDWTFRNCVVSDVSGVGGDAAAGISVFTSFNGRDGVAGELTNTVVENCIVERIHSSAASNRVTGIAVGLSPDPGEGEPSAFIRNVFVRDCRVSDVKRTVEGDDDLVAGITLQSVKRPVVCNNSVSDTVNGILFTGSDLINPPSFFQLAPTLQDALDVSNGVKDAIPGVTVVDLTALGTGMQNFNNTTQANTVTIDAADPLVVKLPENGINTLPTNLNTLNWVAGDSIVYDADGGTVIADLVDTVTYFAVVYVPGFTRCGLVQQNKVDNCRVAGYRDNNDDKDMNPVNTSSAWVDNVAFNNGTPASAAANYAINWAGVAPVMAGDLANYPTGDEKVFNVSLIP